MIACFRIFVKIIFVAKRADVYMVWWLRQGHYIGEAGPIPYSRILRQSVEREIPRFFAVLV